MKEYFIDGKWTLIGDSLHIMLHLCILLKAASLWINIAVVERFYEIRHGSFSLNY